MSEEETWLTIKEAAALVGVSRRTIQEYVKRGKLPAYRSPIRGRLLFRRADLEAFKQPKRIEPGESEKSGRAA